MGPCDVVRTAFDDVQLSTFDQLGSAFAGGGERHDTVRVAVNDQRGNVDSNDVFAKVFVPGGNARKSSRRRGARCDIPAGLNGLLADALSQQLIGIVEVLEKLRKKGIAVSNDGFLNALENRGIDAFGVVRS